MDYIRYLINQHRQNGILIDTKPLLLLLIGTYNPDLIQSSKLTQDFILEDYLLLKELVQQFSKIVTTPNILTEVCNWLKKTKGDYRNQLYAILSREIQDFIEEYTPSKEIALLARFPEFGLADFSILDNAKGKYLVITIDLPLCHYLQNVGVDVINFTQLRNFTLLT